MKQHIEDLYAIIDEQESSIKIYQKHKDIYADDLKIYQDKYFNTDLELHMLELKIKEKESYNKMLIILIIIGFSLGLVLGTCI